MQDTPGGAWRRRRSSVGSGAGSFHAGRLPTYAEVRRSTSKTLGHSTKNVATASVLDVGWIESPRIRIFLMDRSAFLVSPFPLHPL